MSKGARIQHKAQADGVQHDSHKTIETDTFYTKLQIQWSEDKALLSWNIVNAIVNSNVIIIVQTKTRGSQDIFDELKSDCLNC